MDRLVIAYSGLAHRWCYCRSGSGRTGYPDGVFPHSPHVWTNHDGWLPKHPIHNHLVSVDGTQHQSW